MRPSSIFRTAAMGAASLSLVLLAGAAARAQESYGSGYSAGSANLPPAVAEWLEHARQDCRAGFAAHNPIQAVDLTGSGRPSYIADPHKLTCAGEPHLFIGDGPASIELFASLPSGEVVHTGGVLAFSYQVLSDPQGGPPTIAFQTQGTGGGPGGVDDYRWDGRNFRILNRTAMAVPPAYAPSAPSYAPPAPAYGPPPAYAQPEPGYAPPAQGYAQPAPAYGPPPGYAPPAPPAYPPPGYQQ